MNSSIFKRIMVATDGSELVKKAVDTAIEIARQSKTKLYAVRVISMEIFFDLLTDENGKRHIKRNS